MAGLRFRRWLGKITESWRRNDCRCAPLRDAARRIAPQLNAPLGSLEPLLRLWDAEGHQAHHSAPHRNSPQRHSPHRGATQRYAPQR
jgi:hypothetical protein